MNNPIFEKDLQVVFIELTSRCNLNCLYCSRGKWGKRLYSDMSLKTLVQILCDLPKKDLTICPYLAGEPLLYPDLIQAINLIKSFGYNKIKIHTNALFLEGEIAEKLILSNLSDIIFSIDGSDMQDYERIRGTTFEKVKNNIINFISLNNHYYSKLKIGIQNLIPFGKKLKLNKDLEELEPYFEEKIIEYPHNWVRFGEIPESYEKKYTDLPCFFLQYYLVISSNGNYLPCCCCLNEEMVIGNVKDKTAKEIWENKIQDLRDKQINGEYIELCSKCKRYICNR